MSKDRKLSIASEASVQKACLELLTRRGVLAWRLNSRVFMVPGKGGTIRPMRAGLGKGSSDAVGILPGGRFLAVEFKRSGERPTSDQVAWLRSVIAAGGVAVWVDNLPDLIWVLDAVERLGADCVVEMDDRGDATFSRRIDG